MFKLPYLTRDQLDDPNHPQTTEKIIEDIQTKFKLMYEARDAFAREALTIDNRELRGRALNWSENMNSRTRYWEQDLLTMAKQYNDTLDCYVDGSYRQKMRNIWEPTKPAVAVKMMTKDEFTAKILKSLEDDEPEDEIYSEEENVYADH